MMKNVVICFFVICCSLQLLAQKSGGKHRAYKVWVTLSNKDVYKGYLTQLNDSSIAIVAIKGDVKQQFSISAIEQLKFQRKGKMGRSVLIGAGAGLVSGALVGLISGDDEPGWFSMTSEEKSVASGILLLPLGAGVGAVIGTGKEKYEINGKQQNYEQYRDEISRYVRN